MNTKHAPSVWRHSRMLIVLSGFVLAGCAIYPLDDAITPGKEPLAQSGYPGPIPSESTPTPPLPLPTLVDGSPNPMNDYFGTPLADEEVAVINIAKMSEAILTPVYDFENILSGHEKDRNMILYVTNPKTGEKLRLGDDSGSAVFGAMNDEHVVWHFLCDPCEDTRSGLYLHSFVEKSDKRIADKAIVIRGAVKISDQWIAYMVFPDDGSQYAVSLYAYNIETGETLLIDKNVVYQPAIESYFAINDEMVAWIGAGPTINDWRLSVHDLTTHTKRVLNVRGGNARYLSVSQEVLVWWDFYWKGYYLATNAIFTIPVIPPGWDVSMIKSIGPITVRGTQLFWSLEGDEKTHYFTATVAKKESQPPRPTPESLTPTAPVQSTLYP